jgi:hypothetical protein
LPLLGEGEPVFLVWRRDGRVHEQRIVLDLSDRPSLVELDLNTVPHVPVGSLMVDRTGTDLSHYYLELTLMEPADLLPQGSRSAGIFDTKEHRFMGLPLARYLVRVSKTGKVREPELGSVTMTLGGGDRTILLTDILGH